MSHSALRVQLSVLNATALRTGMDVSRTVVSWAIKMSERNGLFRDDTKMVRDTSTTSLLNSNQSMKNRPKKIVCRLLTKEMYRYAELPQSCAPPEAAQL
jgi:hypothetical protein